MNITNKEKDRVTCDSTERTDYLSMTSRAKYDSIATSGVDDGGTISPPPRSPANLAALRLNLLCYSMTNLSPAAIFPFFAIVMAEKTPSKIMVGVIYASQPAMAFLVAPLVPRLTAKFGRIPVTCFGLVVAAAGCAGFGASSSVANWLLFHALEGVGIAYNKGNRAILYKVGKGVRDHGTNAES